MTRDEFIDDYVKCYGVEQYRTPTGFIINGWERIALPCACGEEVCRGWAMVSTEDAETHMELYAPPPPVSP